MQIIFVMLSENHNGINPPTCKIIITKNICKISCITKIILSFLGKTLYCPPIVSSPNGKPQIIRNDNIITIEKTLAPIIAVIANPLKFRMLSRFGQFQRKKFPPLSHRTRSGN